jgi:hypothetical protein
VRIRPQLALAGAAAPPGALRRGPRDPPETAFRLRKTLEGVLLETGVTGAPVSRRRMVLRRAATDGGLFRWAVRALDVPIRERARRSAPGLLRVRALRLPRESCAVVSVIANGSGARSHRASPGRERSVQLPPSAARTDRAPLPLRRRAHASSREASPRRGVLPVRVPFDDWNARSVRPARSRTGFFVPSGGSLLSSSSFRRKRALGSEWAPRSPQLRAPAAPRSR